MSAPQLSLSAKAATGAGTAFPFGESKGVQAHIYSAAGSSCSVVIEGGMTSSGPWFPVLTVTDPSATGTAKQGVSWPWMRLNVSARVSGTISGYLRGLDTNPGPWNDATAPDNTATAIACTSLTDSGLTATRVPFAGTGGLLDDDAALVWDDTNKRLSATQFKGNHIMTASAKATDGAIAASPATIFITKGSALGSSTVANPTATDHDGYRIKIVSTTAYAHVVSFNSGKINGGSLTTATFGAAIGNTLCVVAYQGVWYAVENIGVTIT
jgi:hypothetical protein